MTTANEAMQNYTRAVEESHAKDIRYLERRVDDLEKLMDAKFSASEQAVNTAHVAMQARFESVNEFRATLSDQTKEFVTRAIFDTNTNELARRVGTLETRLAEYDGRIIGWSAGSAAVVLVIAIVAQLLDLGG